jgi:hypothetical protein
LKSKDLKDGEGVTGADVVDGSLGGADLEDGAVSAAKIADGSVDSAKITDGSVAEADIAASTLHVVGTSSGPVFGNGGEGDCVYDNSGDSPTLDPVSFYRDPAGRVYLGGVVQQTENAGNGDGVCTFAGGDRPETLEDTTVFTLPPGFRPELPELQNAIDSPSSSVKLLIIGKDDALSFAGQTLPAGSVLLQHGTEPSPFNLNGISFRAAGG